jgi:ERCC4-type nuclease
MPAFELQLPLDDGSLSRLARKRLQHLGQVEGVDEEALVRLSRAFRSLRAVYAAPEAELARVVGDVSAARIRWFLDAPLDTALVNTHTRSSPASMPNAA